MPKTSPRQRKTTGRVLHEFAHGELKSGPGGKGGKVKSRSQAIAIALKESGSSRYESDRENKRNESRTRHREAQGRTAAGRKAARTRARSEGGVSKAELYKRARAADIPGRAKMTKRQLENALN